MAIAANSYGSVNEVLAYTRHLLDGKMTFDIATRPTLAEVEKFIDRASGILNTALDGEGVTVPVTAATAILACDAWVVMRAAEWAELTQRGHGFDEGFGARLDGEPYDIVADAKKTADFIARTIKEVSDGLTFTAYDKHSERSDPQSSTLEQPKIRRGMFDS